MINGFCESCQRVTGHKRALGWGTFFAAVLTGGVWLLAIPVYPKRCIVCGLGSPAGSRATPTAPTARPRRDPKVTLVVLGCLILAILLLAWLAASASTEDAWVLWVSSEKESWLPTFKFHTLPACEEGIRFWISSNEGFWGQGDASRRRSREEGGYGLWSPVAGGRAWGIVANNKTGARERVELLCLPEAGVPR